MNAPRLVVAGFLALLSCASPVRAQPLGLGNDRSHPELHWMERETEHFVVIYHQGLEETAVRAARVAEQVYGPVTQGLEVEMGGGSRLEEDAPSFSFFQAVRLLHLMYPERAPLGPHEHPGQEAVRFQALVSLAFPPSEISDIKLPAGDRLQARMSVAFMGLAGPLGALPFHYTALLAGPLTRAKTAALRDFLDIFNHRLLSLFYRA